MANNNWDHPPDPDHNVNRPGYLMHTWVHGDLGYVPRKRSCTTTYFQRQRLLLGTGTRTAGPLDIRHDMILLGEYLATPGKRGDQLVLDLDAEQAAELVMATNRTVGPYRRELGQRKLSFLLPGMSFPGPRAMKIRIPEAARGLRPAIYIIMKKLA